jgi:hypoxanthine phosphoribosyltransferase
VDTGKTLTYIKDYFQNQGAASVKICALIDKHERRETDISVDYSCHTTHEGFLVGYGLDYAENFRNLPGIFHLKI